MRAVLFPKVRKKIYPISQPDNVYQNQGQSCNNGQRPILSELGKMGSAVVHQTPDTRKDVPTLAQSVPNLAMNHAYPTVWISLIYA